VQSTAGTSELVPYTRVTTVAKALDSGGGLAPWKASMTVLGLMMRKDLRAQWEALIAQHPDPWYGNDAAKAECKRLVEECSAAGGANDRKEVGSALHTITAQLDRGKSLPSLSDETERDLRAYTAALHAHRLVVVPDMIELRVVLDQYLVAGTFDRLMEVPGFDLPLVTDLKTGGSLDFSWHAIAVQLAAYSRANAIYVQGDAADGSLDQRLPFRAVDQHHGLILWLNAGTGHVEPWLVDLDMGWEAFSHSMWARGWRNQHPQSSLGHGVLARQAADTPDGLVELLEASVDYVHVTKLRGWLQDRLNAAGKDPAAREYVRTHWPPGMPALKQSADHTLDQLIEIETLLDVCERMYRLPFPDAERPVRVESEEPEPEPAQIISLFDGLGSSRSHHPTNQGGAA
jgi:hypothetical protein